jgi:spore maturation protein CgeB
VGDSFAHAARSLGLEVRVSETHLAYTGSKPWRAFCRYFLKGRPPSWRVFNKVVQSELAAFRPNVFLTTGVSPVSSETLKCAEAIGAKCYNYPTDDPWNPNHLSPRYLHSIAHYDVIFTPRRSNFDDFRAAGAKRIEFLPFAYDPRFARPVPIPAGFESPDVLFVGGGDADRIALMLPLISADLTLAIYGSYWGNNPLIQQSLRGQREPDEICRATRAAKINVCLVRRQNRDGHVMRSYEIPAIGGCVLAEDTSDHREMFGESAVYFSNARDLVAQAKRLRDDEAIRTTLASNAHRLILEGRNTYTDRLQSILQHSH